MSGSDVLRQLLCWSAGGQRAITTATDDLDEEKFLAALDAHRLDGRFLRRVASEATAYFSADLIAAVRQRHGQICRDVAAQLAIARHLAAQSGASGDELVLLKGFSLYALTADRYAMRRSGDLDVIAGDLDGFVDRALASGFQRVGEPDQLAEYAVLESDIDGAVELHSYFPMTYLPGAGATRQYDPAHHPGRWELDGPFGVHKLRYPDLVAYPASAVAVPVQPLRILAPELSTLIYASHFFVDYILNLLPLPVGTVRLDEVATIVDLVRLPGFRADVFAGLVRECHGEHVVGMARTLARDLLGVDPLAGVMADPPGVMADPPGVMADPPGTAFPRDLWWDGVDGFPVDLGWDPWQSVYRDVSMTDVLHRLSANVIGLPLGGTARTGALTGDLGDAGRYMHRVAPGCRFWVECLFGSTDEALRVRVRLPGANSDEMSGLSLNFGDYRFEFFYKPAIGHFRADDYSNLVSADNGVVSRAETTEGHDVFDVTIPWKTLGDPLGTGGPVPLLLGTRQQKREWGRMTGGVILPLLLDVTTRASVSE